MTPTTLHVGGASPYDVIVGRLGDTGLGAALADALAGPGRAVVRRIGLVHADEPALATHVDRVSRALSTLDAPPEVVDLPVPAGEAGKTAEVAADCWERLGAAGFTRSDAIVTVGGGAVTDLGGFVAATWLRGVPVVHVPTTLLGMVDAAVGGKTGVNTAAGKNLVGSFHEPAGVVCDLGTLTTLPPAELASGMAEVVKCGFIADPTILDRIEADPAAALDPETDLLASLVESAIAVKIAVVVGDLRETGGRDGHPGREVLNYGHTLGHAIERAEDYRIRHGEAVALGLVFVAELARRTGHLDDETAKRHRVVLDLVGLPTGYDATGFDDLLAAMRVDKKTRGDLLRFVILDGLARPTVLAGPDEADLRASYDVLRGAAT